MQGIIDVEEILKLPFAPFPTVKRQWDQRSEAVPLKLSKDKGKPKKPHSPKGKLLPFIPA